MWESKGFARAFGIVLLLAAKLPQLAPYATALEYLGGILGLGGVVNAGISGLRSR